MIISCDTTNMINNADMLDAAICLLAAKNYLMGDIYYPANMELAKKEGWIWVKKAPYY